MASIARRIIDMALRNVVKLGDDILKKKCREVGEINDKIIDLLDDMKETMMVEKGVGLAAPQVGMLKRICILQPDPEKDIIELINPVITEKEGSQEVYEGCLSVPGLIGCVDRPERLKLTAIDREGNKSEYEFTGFAAVIASHETDHLDGIVYVDKARDIHDPAEDEEEECE